MKDSINEEFNKSTHSVEENEHTTKEKKEIKHDEPHLTLEMSGQMGDAVRSQEFEKRQAELWMSNYQQRPKLDQQNPEIDVNQQFKQSAAKPLTNSFFDSLSDENKAKIEAYKQANPQSTEEKQSQKQGISHKIT